MLNAAKEVVFVALGEGKAEIVQRVLEVRSRTTDSTSCTRACSAAETTPDTRIKLITFYGNSIMRMPAYRLCSPMGQRCARLALQQATIGTGFVWKYVVSTRVLLSTQVQGLPGALPAQMVRPSAGTVTWLLDADSAAGIAPERWSDDPKAYPRRWVLADLLAPVCVAGSITACRCDSVKVRRGFVSDTHALHAGCPLSLSVPAVLLHHHDREG